MKLYSYWRSTAAYRVRIALNLKGLAYETIPVHLTRNGGEQLKPEYRAINPNATVPTLILDDGGSITQSMAILEYLEERFPKPALLPADATLRARVRSAAQIIASDIHPINNLRVGSHLKAKLGHSQDDVAQWMQHWMRLGLAAFASTIEPRGRMCFGDTPTFADLCLIPQLYNARRWGLDMSGLERLTAVAENCAMIAAFEAAAPEQQPDAE